MAFTEDEAAYLKPLARIAAVGPDGQWATRRS